MKEEQNALFYPMNKEHKHFGIIDEKGKRCRISCSCGVSTEWLVEWEEVVIQWKTILTTKIEAKN